MNAHQFSTGDFPFTDEDQDILVEINITALPTAGTLALDGTALTEVPTDAIAAADIDTLSYYPAAGETAGADAYATLMFTVTDNGRSPDTTNTTSAVATLTINLIDGMQMAATGSLAVAPAASPGYTEDVQLTASADTVIADVNGINTASLAWQWQQHAPVPVEGMPDMFMAPEATSTAWADIAEANEAMFTPLQAHVGQYIRACRNFSDLASPAGSESICSTAAQVENVNDAPTSGDTQALVPANATADSPFMFSAANFAYEDEESTPLAQHHHSQPAHGWHPAPGDRW